MSQTQTPTPIVLEPVTIYLPPTGSTESPGWVTINPIKVTNSDGTPAVVQLSNPGTINSGSVQGPDANGYYGWVGLAAVAGDVTVTVLADGIPYYTLDVTVAPPQPEILSVDASAVVTGKPGTTPPAFG